MGDLQKKNIIKLDGVIEFMFARQLCIDYCQNETV